MRISFVVNEVFDGWEATDTRLGGTEESIVRWAEEFVKLGHTARIFRNGRGSGYEFVNGVHYYPRQDYMGGGDVCINVKSPDIAPLEPTWFFTNDTNANEQDLSAYKGVIWPSQYAKDHIKVNNPNVFVIPHGYDPTKIYPKNKLPKTVLYASSPDRGLDDLVSVWPEVVEHHPDAMLLVTYGAKPRDIPNAMFLGNVNETEMNELYNTTDIWCHPCSGGELFGITAIKAQAAGCVPVYYPTMALRETVKSGIRSSYDSLAGDLIRILDNDSLKMAIREDLATYTFPTWESTAKDLLALVVK